MTTEIQIELTKSGIPCIWESGGAATTYGHSVVIANRDGGKKKAVFFARGGHLSCGNHALIPVDVGDYEILVSTCRGEPTAITVFEITCVNKINSYARGKRVLEYDGKEWNRYVDPMFLPAIDAAVAKACDYHCRSVVYADKPKGWK